MARRPGTRNQLELEKLRYEIRSKKLDLWLKPLQLLSTLGLAIAVLWVVQIPANERAANAAKLERDNLCLDDLGRVDEATEGQLQTLVSSDLLCDEAMIVAERKSRLEKAEEESKTAADFISSITSEPVVQSLPNDQQSISCSAIDFSSVERLQQEGNDQLSSLRSARLQLETESFEIRNEMEAEARTGAGPLFQALGEELSLTLDRINELDKKISDQSRTLLQLTGSLSEALTTCTP